MLRIGDFSKLSRVSIRMLRHYDELGLLIYHVSPHETSNCDEYVTEVCYPVGKA